MKNLADLLVGKSTEWRSMKYSWRDMALYALSVGAKSDDLIYTYEKKMKAIPTFGVIPYWGTINIEPPIPHPFPAAMLADNIIHSTIAPLHMEHELIMHQPINPIQGTFVFQDVITDVYDRGPQKGAVIRTESNIHDISGNLICTNISSTLFQEGGGWNGKPMPKNTIEIPNTQPDYELHDEINDIQNMLYRLTGDTNLVHADPDFAQKRGFDRVFMQGLCSFGFACRMAIKAIIPLHPEKMHSISAQMRSILYPNTKITLQIWKINDTEAYFRLLNDTTGKAILEKGRFTWNN